MAFVIAAAIAFAVVEPIQVLPRMRVAPGYSLEAQDGSSYTSETARGVVTLYNFAPTDCGVRCAEMEATMVDVQNRVSEIPELSGGDFRLVTVALNPSSGGDLAGAADRSGADGDRWRWIGTEDPEEIRTLVGSGFRRFFETSADGAISFDPGFVLVDGNGIVRGDYRYSTLASDSQKLTHHLEILADEIRHADGAVAVAYEAAHLFLCYP